MATWTIGGKDFKVTSRQKKDLDALRAEYTVKFGEELDRVHASDSRFDGHHLCHASNPLKPLTTEYLERVHAILGLNPETARTTGASA